MTTADKLTYLQGTKEAIRTAIVNKGVPVPEETTFREYATKIGQIPSGGGGTSDYFTIEFGRQVGGNHGVVDVTFPPHDAGDVLLILHMRTNDDPLTAEPVGFTLAASYNTFDDGPEFNLLWRVWKKVSTGSVDPLVVPGIEITSNGQHAYPMVVKGGDFHSLHGFIRTSIESSRATYYSTYEELPAGDSIVFVDYFRSSSDYNSYPFFVDIESPDALQLSSYSSPKQTQAEFGSITSAASWWNNVAVKFRATTTATYRSASWAHATAGATVAKTYVSMVITKNL